VAFGNEVERDIDLVLITGAGASRPFGASKLFPQMSDWSEGLVKKLIDAGLTTGKNQLLRISRGMDGPRFEETLGTFLRTVTAYRGIENFLDPSLQINGMNQQVKTIQPSQQSSLRDWYQQTNARINLILQYLTESLYEEFGAAAVNEYDAHHGYNWLLRELQILPNSHFVYATTNYDTVGEQGLVSLGYSLDWGRPSQLVPAPEARLNVAGLLTGLGRHIPVFHLHGRVGWYSQGDQQIREIVGSNYQSSWGTPVVVWPDDQKDASSYEAFPVIDELWVQFRSALQRARRVLVLGHSLNDGYLLAALRSYVPSDRIAVTIYAPTQDDLNSPANVEIEQRVQRVLGPVIQIPIVFGPEPSAVEFLRPWFESTEALGR
jgi:hypothetical protein